MQRRTASVLEATAGFQSFCMAHALGPPRLITSVGRGAQLRRSDMFIVQASEKKRPKPHRGGMKLAGGAHAAPPGLKRIARWGVL